VEVNLPPGDNAVKKIAAGAFHTLFLTVSGNVYSTGWNRYGQLGIGNYTDQQDPQIVTVDGNASATVDDIAAGYAHSVFLLSDGTVQSVGRNSAGQLGDGSTLSRNGLGPVGIAAKVTKIAAGYDFTYFLTDAATAWATGQNLGGQLGDGTKRTRLSPVEVLSDVADFAAGQSHGLFLMTDGSVRATGANFDGQHGDNTLESKTVPLSIGENSDFISAGGDSSCLIRDQLQRLYCTGSNRDGQLGFGNESTKVEPTLVPGVNDSVEVAAISTAHSLFLAHPGNVFITGSNTFGELGVPDTSGRTTVELLTTLGFNETTRTSTATSTQTATSTGTNTMTNTTTTVTVSRGGNSGDPGNGPDDSTIFVWVGAISFGIIALLINVVFQRRAASQLEDNIDDARGEDRGDMEMIRAEMSS